MAESVSVWRTCLSELVAKMMRERMWKRCHFERLLDVAIALTAFVAAWYWYRASNVEIPALLNNWDQEKVYDAFNAASRLSSSMNSHAAIWSGCSAVLMGVKWLCAATARRKSDLQKKRGAL
jgi:hypothetical protein